MHLVETTRGPARRLPIELSDHIIAQLSNDYDALHACSLTCRAWLYPTRPLLFNCAQLKSTSALRRFQNAFGTTLPSLPDPIRYFRHLVLVVHSDCTVFVLPQATLERLTKITTLCVNSWGCAFLAQEGGREPLLLPDYFPRVERLQFRYLVAKCMDDFLQLVAGFPRLTALEVFSPLPALVLWPTKADRALDPPPFTLRELNLASRTPYAAAVADLIMRGVIKSQIEVLELDCLDDNEWNHGALLALAAPTLRTLHLETHTSRGCPSSPSIFEPLRGAPLERLSIAFPFLLTASADHLEWVSAALACVSPKNLRHVDLAIRFSLHGLSRFTRWPELDMHLARLATSAPGLKVTFAVGFLRPGLSEGSVQAYRKRLLAELPQCHQQGMEIAVVQEF